MQDSMESKWLTCFSKEKWGATVWKIEFVYFFDMADLVGGNTNLKEIESR